MIRDLGELGINLQKIMQRLMVNQNLMKLLYYNDKDPLAHGDLSKEIIKTEIYGKYLKILPRVGAKEDANSIVIVRVMRGATNYENSEFQNITIGVEVFVPMTQWIIKDSNLRPFCILGEIQKSLNGKVINGLGKITGGDFDLNFLTDEMSCYESKYYLTEYE